MVFINHSTFILHFHNYTYIHCFIFVYTDVYFYLTIHIYTYIYIYKIGYLESLYIYICMYSFNLYIYLYINLSIVLKRMYIYIYISIYLNIHMDIYIYIYTTFENLEKRCQHICSNPFAYTKYTLNLIEELTVTNYSIKHRYKHQITFRKSTFHKQHRSTNRHNNCKIIIVFMAVSYSSHQYSLLGVTRW